MLRLTAAVLVLLGIFSIFVAQLIGIIRASGPAVLNNSVTRVINDSVMATLAEENTSYSELVNIHYDTGGKIASLTYNTVAANMLRSEISANINTAVSKDEARYMYVPWGAFNGLEFMRNFNGGLNLEISQYGYVLTDIHSTFSDAGINQTRHSIFLDVTVRVQGYISMMYVTTEVKTSIIIAETVIVGTVPDAYLYNFGSDDNG